MKHPRSLLLPLCCLTAVGCGNPGPPQPPSLHLATPVTDLSAERVGDRVVLRWTMSKRTTDRLTLTGDQTVQICRGAADGPCPSVADIKRTAGSAAEYDDTLPASLAGGPPKLLHYDIRLLNRDNRTAGGSNPAYVAGGAAPPQAAAVTASSTAAGVLVRWDTTTLTPGLPADAHLFVRLTRTRILRKGERAQPSPQETNAGVPEPAVQTLEAPQHALAGGGWAPEQVLDSTATRGRVYAYAVQLLAQEQIDGHALQLAGLSAQGLPVVVSDRFAPAAPTDLAAAANPTGGTIDLSWTPSMTSTADVAGYRVYRSVTGSAAAPVRVSGAKPVVAPGWSDPTAKPGVRYSYSVSAVNAAGDESPRSAAAESTLPPPAR